MLDSSISIRADPGVYPPSDDTFLLLSTVEVTGGQHVLEMGCGTGIIALHCARAGCLVTAADISEAAVANARANAAANGLHLKVVQSDLFDGVPGVFDVIIFNPPYLSAENSEGLSEAERKPLVGGKGGHEISVRFLRDAPDFLVPGGRIFLLTSTESEARVLDAARGNFTSRKMAEQRMFFESLAVWEMRLGNP